MRIRTIVICAAAVLAFRLLAQFQDNTRPELQCRDTGGRDGRARHCEMREQTVPFTGQLTLDGLTNGGVSVKGWSRSEVLVRSKVETWAEDETEARGLASSIRIDAAAGRVAAAGPSNQRRNGWAVSYEVFTPQRTDLKITAHNGGITISDVIGNVEFSAVNGGIRLNRVAGKVSGRTTNGGVHVQLAGDRWEGSGLDVSTTNGGVRLIVPSNYSASLEATTVNGGLRSSVPGVVPSSAESGKRLSVNLGSGGAPLRFATTNGGVTIEKI